MSLFRNWYALANRMTASEKAIEPAIAALGERYRAQWLIMGLKTPSRCCIADFVLLDRNLILEIDGDSHDEPLQQKKDLLNALALGSLGYSVVRISNCEATRDPAGAVARALAAPPTPPAHYEAALARLLQSYPALAAEPAKKPKAKKPARAKKAPAARASSREVPPPSPRSRRRKGQEG